MGLTLKKIKGKNMNKYYVVEKQNLQSVRDVNGNVKMTPVGN
ncbi:hypothetical protein AAEX37_01774 [Oligella sp. MSHR50489EDL]